MSELFKLLRKSSPVVEIVSDNMLTYERAYPKYWKPINCPLVANDIDIGIEVEVERVAHPGRITTYSLWQQHPDGSLRDNGIEFVTQPMRGDRIHYALNQLFDQLEEGRRFSHRTSIHIHQNALDMTNIQIATECLLYSVFEKLFFKFVGGDRDKNNFCVPWYDSKNYYVIGSLLDQEIPHLEAFRYSALNADALRKFGTLEFRHLGGTDDKVKITRWINLIFCLKKYAMKAPFKLLKHKVDGLNSNSLYIAFANEVFGECVNWLDLSNAKRDMQDYISSVKGGAERKMTDFFKKLHSLPHRSSYWYKELLGIKAPEKDYMFTPRPRPGRERPPRARGVRVELDDELRQEQRPPGVAEMLENYRREIVWGDPIFRTTTTAVPVPPNFFNEDD